MYCIVQPFNSIIISIAMILLLVFLCHIARIFQAVTDDCQSAAPTDFRRGISTTGNWIHDYDLF